MHTVYPVFLLVCFLTFGIKHDQQSCLPVCISPLHSPAHTLPQPSALKRAHNLHSLLTITHVHSSQFNMQLYVHTVVVRSTNQPTGYTAANSIKDPFTLRQHIIINSPGRLLTRCPTGLICVRLPRLKNWFTPTHLTYTHPNSCTRLTTTN